MATVTWQLGRAALMDWVTVGTALVATILVFRVRLNSVWLVLGGALIGWGCISSANRLLKKAHLQRWLARALAAAYRKYASLGPLRAALHLGLFEQPGKNGFFSILLAWYPREPGTRLVTGRAG